MTTVAPVICRFARKYPAAEAVDYIKLLYQNEFGCGHFAPDEDTALARLQAEWDGSQKDPAAPLWEDIGNGHCRLHLAALAKDDLPLAARLFCHSATLPTGSEASFRHKLDVLVTLAQQEDLPLSGEQMAQAVAAYLLGGIRPVHHSEAYRYRYAPHYRVMALSAGVFFPALQQAQRLYRLSKPAILAIDGRCASGKTGLAQLIAQLFPCNCFHMDDFFLPPSLRTKKRLAIPGGNVHYERFYDEVLTPLRDNRAFSYRPFCCQKGDFEPPVAVTPKPFSIVEGSYALHPVLQAHYDDRIFLTVSPQRQIERIADRNGKEMLSLFRQRWIPLEERYFQAASIADCCSVQIDTTSLDD